MAQTGNRGASGAVEIAPAGGIEEIAALSAKGERRHVFRVPGKYVRHLNLVEVRRWLLDVDFYVDREQATCPE